MTTRYFLSPADFRIKRGDTPTLSFVVQTRSESTGAVSALDLTNATSVALFFSLAGTALERTGDISATPTDGGVSYAMPATDWTTVDDLFVSGQYSVEAEILFDDGSVVSVPTVGYGSLLIRPDLG